jgi:hypothetical protein
MRRWKSITPEERETWRESVRVEQQEELRLAAGDVKDIVIKEGFIASFGIFDILWFGLAIFTAFKLGGGGDDE